MKRILWSLICFTCVASAGEHPEADAAWAGVERTLQRVYDWGDAGKVEEFRATRKAYIEQLHREGLAFFDAFTADSRRWRWFLVACSRPPRAGEGAEWLRRYPQIRREFLLAPQVTTAERAWLLSLEQLAKASPRWFEEADRAWSTIEQTLREIHHSGDPGRDLMRYLSAREEGTLKLRELGLEFHRRFPDDARWVRWLQLATNQSPGYFVSMQQAIEEWTSKGMKPAMKDRARLEVWQQEYGRLRRELMASPHASETDRGNVIFNEVHTRTLPLYLAAVQAGPAEKER